MDGGGKSPGIADLKFDAGSLNKKLKKLERGMSTAQISHNFRPPNHFPLSKRPTDVVSTYVQLFTTW